MNEETKTDQDNTESFTGTIPSELYTDITPSEICTDMTPPELYNCTIHSEPSIDGYSFATPETTLGNITNIKRLSDGTLAEIDNYSNKIVRKELSYREIINPDSISVPTLHLHLHNIPFDEHIALAVISAITEGHTVRSISATQGFPSVGTIGRWRVENPSFDEAFKRARAIRAEHYHDKVVDNMDEDLDWKEVPLAKLKFDKLKWLAAVNDPTTFAASKNEKKEANMGTVIIDTGIGRKSNEQ